MECPICLDELGDWAYSLTCGHIYCPSCLDDLIKLWKDNDKVLARCPICRDYVSPTLSEYLIRKIFIKHKSLQINEYFDNLQARLLVAVRRERDTARQDAAFLVAQCDAVRHSTNKELANKAREINMLRRQLDAANYALDQAAENATKLKEAQQTIRKMEEERQKDMIEARTNRTRLFAQQEEISMLRETVKLHDSRARHEYPSLIPQFLSQTVASMLSSVPKFGSGVAPLLPHTMPPSAYVKSEDVSPQTEKQNTQYETHSFVQRTESYSSHHKPLNPVTQKSPSSPSDDGKDAIPPTVEQPTCNVAPPRSVVGRKLQSMNMQYQKPDDVKIPVSSPSSSRTTGNAAQKPAPVVKKRELQTGAAILWRGYGCPKHTAVPACTSPDGYHRFSGKGTNQYATKYSCTICYFSCSESRYR